MKLTEYSSQEITLNVQYIFQTIFTAKKVSTFINRERCGVIRYGHFLYRISYISCLFIWACPSDSVTYLKEIRDRGAYSFFFLEIQPNVQNKT